MKRPAKSKRHILAAACCVLILLPCLAGAATGIVGDIDGFGFGTPVGGDVPSNVFDNRSTGDPTFTDHTIPDTGGSVDFSFPINVGMTFSSVGEAFFTMNLQEVEFLSKDTGERIFLDGIELEAPLSEYTINGVPQSGSTVTRFFDTVVSQGDFHTDVVRLKLPSRFFASLLDGAATVTVDGGGESFAVDYAQVDINQLPCVPPPPNMVAWWPGDGDANDIQGTNNGVLQNGAGFAPGEVGQAFNFDGINQYVRVATSPDLNPTGSFSIDAWIFQTVDKGTDIVAKWGDGGDYVNQRAYVFGTGPNGQIAFSISDVAHQNDGSFHTFLSPNNVFPLNAWNHLAVVYDQTTGTRLIYVNGVQVASRTDEPITITNSIADLGIGARLSSSTTPAGFFPGEIDEVEFFHRALSQAEIQAIFSAGSAGKCKSNCETPTSLSTSNVTDTSATLQWDSVSGAVEYQINYKVVGATKWILVRSSGNSTTLAGLTPGTNYVWRVRTVCSKSPLVASAYSGQVQFTTTEETTTTCDFATNLHTGEGATPSEACGIPANVTEVEILPTRAILRWDAVSGAIGYEIAYREVYPDQGATIYVCTTRVRVTLENLNRNAGYRYQIRAICSEDPLIVSDYTPESEFRTPRQPR